MQLSLSWCHSVGYWRADTQISDLHMEARRSSVQWKHGGLLLKWHLSKPRSTDLKPQPSLPKTKHQLFARPGTPDTKCKLSQQDKTHIEKAQIAKALFWVQPLMGPKEGPAGEKRSRATLNIPRRHASFTTEVFGSTYLSL